MIAVVVVVVAINRWETFRWEIFLCLQLERSACSVLGKERARLFKKKFFSRSEKNIEPCCNLLQIFSIQHNNKHWLLLWREFGLVMRERERSKIITFNYTNIYIVSIIIIIICWEEEEEEIMIEWCKAWDWEQEIERAIDFFCYIFFFESKTHKKNTYKKKRNNLPKNKQAKYIQTSREKILLLETIERSIIFGSKKIFCCLLPECSKNDSDRRTDSYFTLIKFFLLLLCFAFLFYLISSTLSLFLFLFFWYLIRFFLSLLFFSL